MGVYRDFTKDDVEARGKKPWTTVSNFAKELNTESMSETAAAYARAAGEARTVDDLAKRATEISQGAGNLNGAPLAKEGRYEESRRALQRGGTDMAGVVSVINRGINRALDAEEGNQRHITWMDRQLASHQAEGRAKWNGWTAALNHANLHVGRAEDPNVTISYDGRQVTVPRQGLPQWLADEIRESYLKRAVQDAEHAQSQIQDTIKWYRHQMLAAANDLVDLGYELTEGPFELFTTPQMAKYAAGRLMEELRSKNPDPERVEFFTNGLKSIAESIYGDPTKGGASPERDLTAAERAYLRHFYGTLDSESLARLGNLDGSDAITNAKRNVANGIQMVMNPEIGGFDPSKPSSGVQIPQSIRDFVYDYKNGDISRPQDSGDFRKALEQFNGFGDLMSHSTVASGDAFSSSMAHAAIDVEKWSAQQIRYAPEVAHVENTGSSGMLRATAWNHGASAELLRDSQFREDLLTQRWDDSHGAAAVVRSGTTVPSWIPPGSDAAKPYMEAAYGVLTYAAQNGDVINSLHDPNRPGVLGADLSDLQRSIGNTAIRNMDYIATTRDTDGLTRWSASGEPGQVDPWGFGFSSEDREGIFSFMNGAEEIERKRFFGEVANWQLESAKHAFRDPDSGAFGPTFTRIGVIQGTVAEVQNEVETGASTAATGVNVIGTAVTGIPHPVATVIGATTAATGGGTAMYYGEKEGLESELAENRRRNQKLEGLVAIANAAVATDYENAGSRHGDDIRRWTSSPGYDPIAYQSAVLNDPHLSPGLSAAKSAFDSGVDLATD